MYLKIINQKFIADLSMASRKSVQEERVVRMVTSPPGSEPYPQPVPLPCPARPVPSNPSAPTTTTTSTPTTSTPVPSAPASRPSSPSRPLTSRVLFTINQDTPSAATTMDDTYDLADLDDYTFSDPPSTGGDFVMASNLAKKMKSPVDLSQTQEFVDLLIEGRAWRVFIKDLDQFSKVPKDGKTFFYCFAEPGGGFSMRDFHDHLAKHNMGAFTPTAREGKFSEIGEELLPESFGSLVERFSGRDRMEYIKYGEPMVQIGDIKTLGDVIFDLYSTGILSSGEVEFYNEFRVKYKVEKIQHPTSAGVAAARQLFVNGTLAKSSRVESSGSESDVDEEVDEENTVVADRKEVDSIERGMAEEGLDGSIDEEGIASETVTKEKYQALASKYNKSATMLARSYAVLHNQQKTIDSFQAKKSVISARTISNCLKAYCGPKFTSLEKMHNDSQVMLGKINSNALNAAARSGSILAIERNRQKEAHNKKMQNPPPPPSTAVIQQRQRNFAQQQAQNNVQIPNYAQLPQNFAQQPQIFAQPGLNFPNQQLFQQQHFPTNFQQQQPVFNNFNQAQQIVGLPQTYNQQLGPINPAVPPPQQPQPQDQGLPQ